MTLTYSSLTQLNLGSVPDVEDPVVYQALLDIHNAIEILLQSKDIGETILREELTVDLPLNDDETALLAEVTNFPTPEPYPTTMDVNLLSPLETTERGGVGVPVFVQDQTTDTLDLYFLQAKASGLTLAADTSIDSRTVVLTAGHGLTTANSANHILELAIPGNHNFYQGRVISVTGDSVLVAPPINYNFPAATTLASTGNPNMCKDAATGVAIDGSTTPVIFSLAPIPGQSGDITGLKIAMTSTNAMDLTTFGGAPALAVGITLRVRRADGTFKNLFTIRDNFSAALYGSSSGNFEPKQGNSIRGFVVRKKFAGQDNHGVTVRLDGNFFEELQVVVSELMDSSGTGNLTVSILAEGSELQE